MNDNVLDFAREKERRGALEELTAIDQGFLMLDAVGQIVSSENLTDEEREAKVAKLAAMRREFEEGRVKAEERLRNA